jgi:pSer/pThr/pTyr-binding forkhead associated (FHA) protein
VLADDTLRLQLHARIHRDPEQTWVEDLGSTNGTYLNGNRLTGAHVVAVGDRISIGAAVLEAR